jgi:hypothetical protein
VKLNLLDKNSEAGKEVNRRGLRHLQDLPPKYEKILEH